MAFDAKRKRRAYNERHNKGQKARRNQRRDELALARGDEYGIRAPSGRRTKLDRPTYTRICTLLAEGQTLEVTATLSGIEPTTLWTWVSEGQRDPDGPFGQFARDVQYAKEASHRFLVNKIAFDEDWKAAAFLLKNRYPKFYRDHVTQQIEGPDGQPLQVGLQTFSVVLELHPDGLPKDEQQREFRIEGTANGAVHVASSTGSQSNGSS